MQFQQNIFFGPQSFSLKQFFSINSNDDVVLKFSEEYAYQVYYVHKARVAIRFACKLMKIGYGDEVLAPAYNCGTEVDAIINSGASVTLYRIDKTGQIDIVDLQRRISSQTKLIYIIHYFGFPQSLTEIKELCKKKNIYLLEDCALSLFNSKGTNRIFSTTGDISVFNFPKTLPVPDGGMLVVNNPSLHKDAWVRKRPQIVSILRNLLPLLKSYVLRISEKTIFYPLCWSILKRTRKFYNNRSKQVAGRPEIPCNYYYNEKLNNRAISGITKRILKTYNVSDVIEQRRKNFSLYASSLADTEGIKPLYKTLPDDVCPLWFPIIVSNRKQVCRKLNNLSIEAIEWWSGYHRALLWDEYPEACFLKDNLLVLPVHQQLSEAHINFISEKLISFIGNHQM